MTPELIQLHSQFKQDPITSFVWVAFNVVLLEKKALALCVQILDLTLQTLLCSSAQFDQLTKTGKTTVASGKRAGCHGHSQHQQARGRISAV